MKIVADESIDEQIVRQLRQDKYDVFYVAESDPGITDDVILQQANESESLLITADKDFGELVFRQGFIHTGVVLIRLSGVSPEGKAEIVSEVFNKYFDKLIGNFTVISPSIVRIRSEHKKSYRTSRNT